MLKVRSFALFLVLCMLLGIFSGCGKKEDEWITEESMVEVTGESVDEDVDEEEVEESVATGSTTSKKSSSKSTSSKKTVAANKRPQKQPSSNGITTAWSGKDPNANYKVKGKLSVCVNTNRPTDYEALFDSFQTVYKDVELEIRYFADGDTSLNYVLQKASTGNLPDVVFDDAAPVPTYVAQGLCLPLDNYVKNDPDIKYVSSEILDTYRYGGKLFALPDSIHFSCMMINKDIVKDLNLKMPALDWTIDEFVAFLKSGSTDKYSGCEMLFGNYLLAAQLCPIYDKNVGLYGYNFRTGSFNLAPLTKGLQLTAELRKVPNLEAFALRMSGIDKYTAKFGASNPSDTRMALKLGKTLVEVDSGTWQDPNLGNFKFDTVLWPYPQSEKGRMPIHVDHSFIIKSSQNPDAAFQLLRFVTYSTEGNLARLSMYSKGNRDKYVLSSKFYIPVTSHPEVKAAFNALGIADNYQYMYNNVDKCYRADPTKYVPGIKEVIKANATSEWDAVNDGLKDAASVNSTMEGKLNTAMAKYLKDFNAKIAKLYK